MYVCLCQGVTEGEIRNAVREGLCTLQEIQEHLGVASGCGKCAEFAIDVVQETLRERPVSFTDTSGYLSALLPGADTPNMKNG